MALWPIAPLGTAKGTMHNGQFASNAQPKALSSLRPYVLPRALSPLRVLRTGQGTRTIPPLRTSKGTMTTALPTHF